MLQRDLKKMAADSLFNPNKADVTDKVLLNVGNPVYWVTKAVELLMATNNLSQGSVAYHNNLREAIKLLLITRVETYATKKPQKAGNTPTKRDNQTTEE